MPMLDKSKPYAEVGGTGVPRCAKYMQDGKYYNGVHLEVDEDGTLVPDPEPTPEPETQKPEQKAHQQPQPP